MQHIAFKMFCHLEEQVKQLKKAMNQTLQHSGLKRRLEILSLLVFWLSYKKTKKLESHKLLKASVEYILKKNSL